MVKIKLNGKELNVSEGLTIFQASDNVGIAIPAMCYHPSAGHFASCMVCMVKDKNTGKLLPSCSVTVEENMNIITDDDEITEARKTALELLLSDHVGDCEAPCQIACPAHMDIPLMNRLLAEGKTDQALKIVRNDIILPSVLGRICPAPCEGACRRKTIDDPVSICLLKRFAGDHGMVEKIKPVLSGKRVALIGAGPAGLAAAFHLQIKGIQSVIYDKNEKPGGALMYAIPDEKLDKKVVEREIQFIKNSGVEFIQNRIIDAEAFKNLTNEYDAVVIATGDFTSDISDWGFNHNTKQILTYKNTHQTNLPNVFAIGNVNRSTKYAVRSVGQGKEVAFSIEQYLNNKPVTGEPRMFNSRFGKLVQEEFIEYLNESPNYGRTNSMDFDGFSLDEVIKEAKRCMHCDCRKLDNCKLRVCSNTYQASQKRFYYEERKPVRKQFNHELIVYEPEKCIKCGICVRITEKYKEKFGFTFIGRGFEVEIGIPFNETLQEGIAETAKLVAEACPTGALAVK